MFDYARKELIYENPLRSGDDLREFILEGSAKVTATERGMLMENALDEGLGQKSNFVYWLNRDFGGDMEISWKFTPIREPGLAIMFFNALGLCGGDIFDAALPKRTGEYDQYHSGAINCYHVSYFRRKWAEERGFHTCNLRKSKGFHLVAQGADPIPNVDDCKEFYEITIVKKGADIRFLVDELPIFQWRDDGSLGAPPQSGKIGFRQMAPLAAVYADLRVFSI
jgi:hypothetical protein